MTVPFHKMHGLGNDCVIFDARHRPLTLNTDRVRRLADRRLGIGCDQLIVLRPAPQADAFMEIRNADGREVEACGNATRCVARLLMAESGRRAADIETAVGLLPCTATDQGVCVDMGPARLDWREIPLAGSCDTLDLPLDIPGLGRPTGVNIGNPHAVFFVADAEAVDSAAIGPRVETDSLFPQGTNVEFVSLLGPDRLRMRVWERGVGVTRACGSGACATAVAAARRGLTGRRVGVELDGGSLTLDWAESGHVLMEGPACYAFAGTVAEEQVL